MNNFIDEFLKKVKDLFEKDSSQYPLLERVLYVILSAPILLVMAFYNGYPLIFSDTGSYIEASLRMVTASDRPLGYGYFIRLIAHNGSLWLVILAQALLLNYLLFRVVGIIFQKNVYKIHLGLVTVLALFSSVSWFTSQVMPDIFVAILILSVYVLFVGKPRWYEEWFLYWILFLCLQVHFGNFLIFALVGLLLGGYLIWRKNILRELWQADLGRKVFFSVVILVFAPLIMMGLNYRDHKVFTINPAGHVFMMSRLNESGVLGDILDEECPVAEYVFCDYPRPYPEHDGFIWDQKSPMNILGWFGVKVDSDAIIHKAFTTPKYLFKFGVDSAVRSLKMVFYDGLDSFDPYYVNTSTYRQISNGYPQELGAYKRARQYQQNLVIRDFAAVFYFILTIASLVCLLFLFLGFWKNSYSSKLKLLFLTVVGGVFANAIVFGTLSGNYDRYNSRVVWLFPMLVLIFLINWLWPER